MDQGFTSVKHVQTFSFGLSTPNFCGSSLVNNEAERLEATFTNVTKNGLREKNVFVKAAG
ncbi:hypothetical protein EXN66_Car019743 [Channa argus]|uniref:Uncharacterized protein n=1 Tax=Channa argus TaxID=215402 RepID=A0A6G1QNC5_CHAAH|nr:hypothetical protein EXN66_Car019743 [Channa argus]